MSGAFRFETFIDTHSNIFNEYLSSVVVNLSKENEEYKAIQDEIESLYQQYPKVLGVFDTEQATELTKEECAAVIKVTYGDKKKIIEDCVDDILPFIDYVLSDYCIPSNEQKFVGDHSDVEISLDFINELFPGEDYNNEENESETVTFSVDELYSSN